MKKKKVSGFKQIQRKKKKESLAAGHAVRNLYPDEAFIKDFDSACQFIMEETFGHKKVQETVRVRIFPDQNDGVIMEGLTEKNRVSTYQMAGTDLGKAGKALVACFQARQTIVGKKEKQESLVVRAMTVDGREMMSIYGILMDSQKRIQNFKNPVHYFHMQDVRVAMNVGLSIPLGAFLAGYRAGLSDHFEKK